MTSAIAALHMGAQGPRAILEACVYINLDFKLAAHLSLWEEAPPPRLQGRNLMLSL